MKTIGRCIDKEALKNFKDQYKKNKKNKKNSSKSFPRFLDGKDFGSFLQSLRRRW